MRGIDSVDRVVFLRVLRIECLHCNSTEGNAAPLVMAGCKPQDWEKKKRPRPSTQPGPFVPVGSPPLPVHAQFVRDHEYGQPQNSQPLTGPQRPPHGRVQGILNVERLIRVRVEADEQHFNHRECHQGKGEDPAHHIVERGEKGQGRDVHEGQA